MKFRHQLTTTLASLALVACASTPSQVFVQPDARQRYPGQTPPGVVPELFAPGLVSTEAIELNGVFSPDMREFVFTRLIEGARAGDGHVYPHDLLPVMFRSVFADGEWSAPQPLPVYPEGSRGMAVDMAFSPDGRELYFLGQYPDGKASLDLWVSRRHGDGWSLAEPLAAPVSTEAVEIYPVVVADGSLYFSSDREGGLGGLDLWRAQRLPDGGFAEPVNPGAPINSEWRDADAWVAPDESYMVLTSYRPGGYGDADLYVSFRQRDGGWGALVNLGPDINTAGLEYCPMLTPDGKYLFFSRRRSEPPDSGWAGVVEGDVYWVDASATIERLRDADAQRAALAEQVRREIMPLFEAMQATAQAFDADAHVAFWARRPESMLVGSFLGSEVKLVGWDAILEKQREWWAGARPDPANPAYGLLEGPDVVVADAAHAMLYFVLEARGRDAEGVARKFRLMISQLWQKQDDGWKVVHAHESLGGEIAE